MNIKHDREAVLKTGLGLLCRKGYNSLGIDEICKTTGMTKGAFYNAFKSKEQFLVEAIELYSENNIKRIKAELMPNAEYTAFEKLQRFYLNMLEIQPKLGYIGCFVNNIMSEMGTANALVRDTASREFNKFIEVIEPSVIKAQEEGDINKDVNSKEITELLHATFYGLLTISKSSQDPIKSLNTINLLFNNLKTKKNG